MNYADRKDYETRSPVYVMVKTLDLPCKSELCRNRKTKHAFNRTADDGTRLYVCCTCGEERAK